MDLRTQFIITTPSTFISFHQALQSRKHEQNTKQLQQKQDGLKNKLLNDDDDDDDEVEHLHPGLKAFNGSWVFLVILL